VYPSQQAWSPTFVDYAVKTNPLQLRDGEDVTVWLEANLATSVVELARR